MPDKKRQKTRHKAWRVFCCLLGLEAYHSGAGFQSFKPLKWFYRQKVETLEEAMLPPVTQLAPAA